jgi:Family of unknown function (DUF6152)
VVVKFLEAGAMKFRVLVLGLGLMLVYPGSTLFAHHSTAMYNMANPTTVTGTVKRFEWTNPHAYIYLEVKDESGNTTEWTIEMMSLNHLKSYGWSRNTVQPGDVITCTGGAAKGGQQAMLSSLVKLANGDVIKS